MNILQSTLLGLVTGYMVSTLIRRKKKPVPPERSKPAVPPPSSSESPASPVGLSFLEEKMWYEGEINFLFKFNEKLIAARGFQDVTRCIAEAAHNFLPIEHTVLLTWDKNTQTFTPACVIGWKVDQDKGPAAIGRESISGVVIQNRETLVVPDLEKNHYLKTLNKEDYLQKTFISAPLIYKNEVLGVLHVCGKKTPEPFTQKDVSVVMNIVRMGAITLENALLLEQALKRAAELETAYGELKDMQDKLIQSEKLKAIGQLASGVAHEMRNPIGIIMQGVSYLEQITPPESKDTVETLTMVKDSAQRADRIVTSLLDYSRATKLELREERLDAIIDNSLNLVKTELKEISVVKELQNDLPALMVDKNKMMQIFINLFVNAAHAMPDGGQLTIRGFASEVRETGERVVVVEVEDTGTGISEENLKKIFDPFFTTKGAGKGTGLGLSLCQNIIDMHKGRIEASSELNKGTKFTVTLKAGKEESHA